MKTSQVLLGLIFTFLAAAAPAQDVPMGAHLDCAAPAPECIEMQFAAVNEKLQVKKDPEFILGPKEISSLEVVKNDSGPELLRIRLEPAPAEKLRQMTAANIGRRFVLVHAGRVLIAPFIQDVIGGGNFVISWGLGDGGHSIEWLRKMAEVKKSDERRTDFNVMMIALVLSTLVFVAALYYAFRKA
jgi:hypothetical protein